MTRLRDLTPYPDLLGGRQEINQHQISLRDLVALINKYGKDRDVEDVPELANWAPIYISVHGYVIWPAARQAQTLIRMARLVRKTQSRWEEIESEEAIRQLTEIISVYGGHTTVIANWVDNRSYLPIYRVVKGNAINDKFPVDRDLADRQDHKTGSDKISDSDHTDANADTHGGDGNSGEIDAQAEKAASAPRQGITGASEGSQTPQSGGQLTGGSGHGSEGTSNGQGTGNPDPNNGSDDKNRPDAGKTEKASSRPTLDAPAKGRGSQSVGSGNVPESTEDRRSSATAPGSRHSGISINGIQKSEGRCGDDSSDGTDTARNRDIRPREKVAIKGNKVRGAIDSVTKDQANVRSNTAGNHTGKGKDSAGGIFATLLKKVGTSKETKEVKRALMRMIPDRGRRGDPSPRVDGGRLVRELVTRRYQLSKTHRSEMEISRVLFMCDTSGSCSAVAEETLAACQQIAAEMPDQVGLIVTSNGQYDFDYGVEGWCRDAHQLLTPKDYVSFVKGRNVKLVVVFGDHDGVKIYHELAKTIKIIWLDSFRANQLDGKAVKRFAPHNISYYIGVHDARGAAYAFRQEMR